MIQLRADDQEPFVANLRASLTALRKAGKPQRVMAVAPCGFGKTVCFSYMAMRASAKGIPVAITVHRKELVDQISSTLRSFNVKHGIIAPGYAADPRQLVQVSSVFSLARRLDRTRKPGFIMFDEGHHCVPGTTWGNVIEEWHDVTALAFTATPSRLSGEGFEDLFGDMVVGPSARWLIDNGHLNQYRLFAPQNAINTNELHKRAGEFVAGEVEELMTRPRIVGNAIDHYEKMINGAPSVAFCVSIKAAQMLAQSFRDRGWKAACVDGTMKDEDRRQVIRDCRAGALNVTTSCALIGEGLDVGSLRGAILMNPTTSLSKYIQEAMRPLRKGADRSLSIILDHAGNSLLHGAPDLDREWSLKGRDKRKREAQECPITSCPMCYRSLRQGSTACPCGYKFEAKPREVDQVEGDLQEVDVLAQRRAVVVEQARARSLEDLIAVGRKRGMAKPEAWAAHVIKGREEKARREAAAMAERYERETGT